jgi:hypothetical protein
MAESVNLDLIGKTVLETKDAVRKLAGLPEAVRQLQDDQTVMIRLLQAREAKLDPMCSLEHSLGAGRRRSRHSLARFGRGPELRRPPPRCACGIHGAGT